MLQPDDYMLVLHLSEKLSKYSRCDIYYRNCINTHWTISVLHTHWGIFID